MAAAASYPHAPTSASIRSTRLAHASHAPAAGGMTSFLHPNTVSLGPLPSTSLGNAPGPGAASSTTTSSSSNRASSRAQLRALDTSSMSGLRTSSNPLSGTPRPAAGHAKLHKKGPSASSLPGPPSPFAPQFGTPVATHGEPFPDVVNTPTTSSTPKIKPFLRKVSKEDQGRLDLSKPAIENDQLSGLGIVDFAAPSKSDIPVAHVVRRGTHARTTSVGSQVSIQSGVVRTSQPFVHPMRQTPRPFTPPASVHHDDANERDDIVEDDFRLAPGFRSRRSMSISSMLPTPLSQSHTAVELTALPSSSSQPDVSLNGPGQSGRGIRPSQPRQVSDFSIDTNPAPAARASFERAFSAMSRRSEPEPQSRDERIRAARRKFEEKEASKDLKHERNALKRRETEDRNQERQLRKSESSNRTCASSHGKAESKASRSRHKPADGMGAEKLHATSYDETRPTHKAALPRVGKEAGMSEKRAGTRHEHKSSTPQGNWVRFSAWLQTRMMNCARAT